MKSELNGPKPRSAKHNPILLTGSILDKHAVIMDDGKTIIFISDKSKESETRQKYMMQRQQINIK